MKQTERAARLTTGALLGLLIALGIQILLNGMMTFRTVDFASFTLIQAALEVIYLVLGLSIGLRIVLTSLIEELSLGPIESSNEQLDKAISYIQLLEKHIAYNDDNNPEKPYVPYASTELELQIKEFVDSVNK